MQLADVQALLTPPGRQLLASLPQYDDADALGLGARLRDQGYEPALVSAALTQARLRQRARDKLGPAAEAMVFTPDGLEQATRRSVAAHHARRYLNAGCARVLDLGCGLGSDAMAFAELGLGVLAVDADELTATLAAANLAPWPTATVRCADATAIDLDTEVGPGDGVWLDPARRVGASGSSRRTFDPEAFSPPYSFVLDLMRQVPATGAKLAPGIDHRLLPDGAEAQWVSVKRGVVECALWSGSLGRPTVRRSALLIDGAEVAHDLTGEQALRRPDVGPVGAFLHEPDGAVIRAGLVADVAAATGGRLLDATIAYLCTDAPVESPFVSSYTVHEVLPYHLKTLRSYLRERGVGQVTIKKRGSAIDPDVLRRQLRLSGDAHATLVLTRVAGRPTVLVVSAG